MVTFFLFAPNKDKIGFPINRHAEVAFHGRRLIQSIEDEKIDHIISHILKSTK